MKKKDKLKRKISLFIVNNFLSTTRYFSIKRVILNFGKIYVGKNTNVVGPIFCGTEVSISIGDNCWIGKNLNIEGNGEVTIGDNCDIAPSIMIITGSHEKKKKIRAAGTGIDYSISIGDGCWIGARCTLFGNITIGKMSVIGAMSLVCKDISKYSIVAGIPCKLIRHNK